MTDAIDLFCGAGGFSVGFEKSGYTVLGAADVNKDFLNTYRENAPEVTEVVQCDLFELDPEELQNKFGVDSVPIVFGGPPCKGFSLAGERDEDDERNQLVFEFWDHAFAYDPDVIVMENVPGILSMDVLPEVEKECNKHGYNITYKTLDASEYGVPQSRQRVFTIGIKQDSEASFEFPTPTTPSPITVEEAIVDPDLTELDNHESTMTNHQKSTVEDLSKLDFEESRYDNYSESWKRLHPEKPAPTIKENHGAPFVHPFEDRVGTVRECAILQSFPNEFTFVGSKSTQLKTVGNAVPPKLAKAIADSIKL